MFCLSSKRRIRSIIVQFIVRMSQSPEEKRQKLSFSPPAPLSPAEHDQCSICKKKGDSFNQRWVGCLGCSYWVCVDCAFGDFPCRNLLAGGLSQRLTKFFHAVATHPKAPWQYLCPNCINDIYGKKVDSCATSPIDSSQVTPNTDIPKVTPVAINELKEEFSDKIASLTSVISNIDTQIKELKLSMDTKVTSWSDVVKKNLVSSSSLSQVIQTTIESVTKENDKNKVLIISNIPETGNFEDDRLLLLDFIKGLQIPEYQPDIRNVVRLGRKDKDLNRLIKVTFMNEVSAKIIMAGHRQCIKQNIDWSITEDLSKIMKLPPEFPKCVPFRRSRVRPDLPKEKRDKMKINSQKVYHMNNEIRTKADTAGVPVSESYSLRQDGNIVRFRLRHKEAMSPAAATFQEFRRRLAGETPNDNYLEKKNECHEESKWIKDNNWKDDSSGC